MESLRNKKGMQNPKKALPKILTFIEDDFLGFAWI